MEGYRKSRNFSVQFFKCKVPTVAHAGKAAKLNTFPAEIYIYIFKKKK